MQPTLTLCYSIDLGGEGFAAAAARRLAVCHVKTDGVRAGGNTEAENIEGRVGACLDLRTVDIRELAGGVVARDPAPSAAFERQRIGRGLGQPLKIGKGGRSAHVLLVQHGRNGNVVNPAEVPGRLERGEGGRPCQPGTGHEDGRTVRFMDVMRHFRSDFEHAAGDAQIGQTVRLRIFQAVERLVLDEQHDGAECLAAGLTKIGPVKVDGHRLGAAERSGNEFRLGQIAPADGNRQIDPDIMTEWARKAYEASLRARQA